MALKVEKHKNCMVVRIQAEKLDSIIAPDLKAHLVNINSEGAKNIILDLSDSRYCDSSGLSAILVGNRLCKNAGGKLVITGVREPVKKLILISQLDSILHSALSVDDGIKLLGEVEASK
ncbi:MAG TPA: STAS domain-containing protein [Bacteroidia bacterium]|jgi:anti-sigma B factor antagonist|nr:STAS domain-containing protein [Bacteroidia bacterium]